MTESRDHLSEALQQLRGEVDELVTAPAAARLRARAVHQLRVRRTAAMVTAVAAVAAIMLGGNTLLRPTAGPPVPPAGSPNPVATPVTASPRPSPRPVAPIDDPIAGVDWQRATVAIPSLAGCPDGPVEFAPDPDSGPEATARGPRDGYPAIVFAAGRVAYGDLTGDGRAEAVLVARCARSAEGLASGHGDQVLVVARGSDGTLAGIAWTGVFDALYHSVWVAQGRLLIDAAPYTSSAFPDLPGLALSYEWDGSGFVGWEPAADYPPILPLDPDQPGPPVRLGAVASGLGCPDEVVRFTRAGNDWGGSATVGGATYTIPSGEGGFPPYLIDLDRSGERLLVVPLRCERPDGSTGQGLAVYERAGEGWRGISILLPPTGQREPSYWSLVGGGRFLVTWTSGGPADPAVAYRWTGNVLEPIDEEPVAE